MEPLEMRRREEGLPLPLKSEAEKMEMRLPWIRRRMPLADHWKDGADLVPKVRSHPRCCDLTVKAAESIPDAHACLLFCFADLLSPSHPHLCVRTSRCGSFSLDTVYHAASRRSASLTSKELISKPDGQVILDSRHLFARKQTKPAYIIIV